MDGQTPLTTSQPSPRTLWFTGAAELYLNKSVVSTNLTDSKISKQEKYIMLVLLMLQRKFYSYVFSKTPLLLKLCSVYHVLYSLSYLSIYWSLKGQNDSLEPSFPTSITLFAVVWLHYKCLSLLLSMLCCP